MKRHRISTENEHKNHLLNGKCVHKLLNEIFTCSKLCIVIATGKAHKRVTKNIVPEKISFIKQNTLKNVKQILVFLLRITIVFF